MWIVGLMSGTSADGIDAALVDWPDGPETRPFELLAYRERPHPPALQAEIHRLAAGELDGRDVLEELIRLDRRLADHFAEAVIELLDEAGLPLSRVAAIASHGQTVAHHPQHGGSLQIGCPARLAERLERPVVADFRRRDLAMGGEGAPLAPFFHQAVFADAAEHRGVLNLGGIANLTWLPAGLDPEQVVAFDTGPANSLIDSVVSLASEGRERFDRDGTRARAGRVVETWLAELLDDEYLERPPPKSTGRERYGTAEARHWLERARREGVALDDLVATLLSFTVRTIAQAWRGLVPSAEATGARIYVGGGGARNGYLMASLAEALPEVTIEPMDAGGVPADAAEAMAFSLMGRDALRGRPNHLPRVTGSPHPRVLGVVHGVEWLG